ncbi:MAG: carboxypeptidase-like regulatory domain-containing protein, partial [Bacteroidales bacterium]
MKIIIQEYSGEKIANPQENELSQTIRGKVIDRDSKAPVAFANVVVLTTDPMKGTTTNMEGEFSLQNVPIGRHTLRVSFIGYEETVIPELKLGSGKELVLNIEITEKLESIDEITVTTKKGQSLNQMAVISYRSFSVEETKRYAASISDPAR